MNRANSKQHASSHKSKCTSYMAYVPASKNYIMRNARTCPLIISLNPAADIQKWLCMQVNVLISPTLPAFIHAGIGHGHNLFKPGLPQSSAPAAAPHVLARDCPGPALLYTVRSIKASGPVISPCQKSPFIRTWFCHGCTGQIEPRGYPQAVLIFSFPSRHYLLPLVVPESVLYKGYYPYSLAGPADCHVAG